MLRINDDIAIDDREIEESFVRSSGPGGQNVNKLSTAVQLRFDVRGSPSLPNDVAIRLISERGYEETTLRDIARAAGVSVGLLYRYFPSKQAVIVALYNQLSTEFARQTAAMKCGTWRERFVFALQASLSALQPHRTALRALIPVLVGDPDDGVFAAGTAFSRVKPRTRTHSAASPGSAGASWSSIERDREFNGPAGRGRETRARRRTTRRATRRGRARAWLRWTRGRTGTTGA